MTKRSFLDCFALEHLPMWLRSSPLHMFGGLFYVLFYERPALWEWPLIFSSWFILALGALTFNHRYFAHIAFKTSRVMRFFMAYICCMGMQQGPLWWSSMHRRHHKKCDLPGDPHSWKQSTFMYAWLGWIFIEREVDWEWVHPSLYVTDSKGKRQIALELLFLDNYWMLPFFLNQALLYTLGVSVRNIIVYYTAPSWFVAPPILLFNVMFHPQDHPSPSHGCCALDNAADVLSGLLGESMHEYHHKFPNLAKRPCLFDVAWYTIIQPLAALGLIWDVKTRKE